MSKVGLSVVVAALLLGTVVVGAVSLLEKTSSTPIVAPAVDLSELRAGIEGIHKEIASLRNEVATLRGLQESAQLAQAMNATAGSAEGGQAPAAQPAQFKTVVAAVLEEARRVEEEERQRAREDREQRMEERRREFEALREGPYDRYNLKVNSPGSVLNMNDAQKQNYYNLVTAYNAKLEESMRALREQGPSARGGEEGEGEEGGRRRGRGGRNFEQMRELSTSIQAEFEADMRSILSSAQYEIYDGLSRDAKSFQNSGMVSAGGEEDGVRGLINRLGGGAGGPGGGGGGGFGGGGFGGGGGGGGGRGGGGGGGRGGRGR